MLGIFGEVTGLNDLVDAAILGSFSMSGSVKSGEPGMNERRRQISETAAQMGNRLCPTAVKQGAFRLGRFLGSIAALSHN